MEQVCVIILLVTNVSFLKYSENSFVTSSSDGKIIKNSYKSNVNSLEHENIFTKTMVDSIFPIKSFDFIEYKESLFYFNDIGDIYWNELF